MNVLIWKEWRENLKWLPLPGLAILIVTLLDPPDVAMPDVTGALFFCLIGVVFGAALGFLQVFFEGHGDKRSILWHRPLSPARIFLAKALAGVSLYLVALGVPFLCLEIWLATPGSIPAPYHWRTSLPWLADILSGLVYYFAGILAAQREGRWYGSRCLGLLAAFFCSYLVWTLPEFWQALLAIGFVGCVVAVAAYGSFAAGGAYAPQPRLSKAALALTFLLGLLIPSALGKQLIGYWFGSRIYREFLVDNQGRILSAPFQTTVGALGLWTDENNWVPADLEGQLVDSRVSALFEAMESPLDWSYRNNGRFYIKCANDTVPWQEVWYYDQIRHRLFGYDKVFHQSLGTFGPEGFSPAGLPSGSLFTGELRYRTSNYWFTRRTEYLTFSDGVYQVDFARRQIRAFFTPPANETILFADWGYHELDHKRRLVGVSTDQSFYLMPDEAGPVTRVPRVYQERPAGLVYLGRLENPERYFVWYQSWKSLLQPEELRTAPTYLLEYDLNGRELARRTSVPPPPLVEASYGQALFGLATPITEAALFVGLTRDLRQEAHASGSGRKSVFLSFLENSEHCIPGTSRFQSTPNALIPLYLSLILLSAAGCGVGCFLLARRHAFSTFSGVGWAVIGLLLGWVGLLLMLAIKDWPARVVCRKCHQARVVSRDSCEHCGALHAPPAQDGTEIFETVSSDELHYSIA
jgi:hypothetical protein